MKLQWLVVGAAVVAVGVYIAVQVSDGPSDPPFTRDRLVDGNSLVVTFRPDGLIEGYKYTLLDDGEWLWERTTPDGLAGDAFVYNGKDYLLRLAPGCYAKLDSVTPPLIPGVTTTPRLKGLKGRRNMPDGTYQYDVEVGEWGWNPAQTHSHIVVDEDLAHLKDPDESYEATTTGPPAATYYGHYVIEKAPRADRDNARAVISAAKASPTAQFTVRMRTIASQIGDPVTGPYTVLVAQGCPDAPGQLYPASAGGQRSGARVSAFVAGLRVGPPAVVTDAHAVIGSIFGPREEILAVAQNTPAADVPVKVGQLLTITTESRIPVAVQITACEGTAFFRCN